MINYRKLWENSYGVIPKDEDGRSYEIHHIDGNRNNNDLINLSCVSIKDHYQIHLNQGDIMACIAISFRMSLTKEDLSKLISTMQLGKNTQSKLKEKSPNLLKVELLPIKANPMILPA